MLAGGTDLIRSQRTSLSRGGDLGFADTLDAERALLHHAAFAHRDIGILCHQLGFAETGVVIEPVEATNLVGTVVRAEARADAPVVNHLVETIGAVHGRFNRTDVLARRLLAVLTQHGLWGQLRRLGGPFIGARVPIDAQPVHLASLANVVGADHRHVVLRLACNGARSAANAGRKIDRHRPLLARRAIGQRRGRLVQREDARRLGRGRTRDFGERHRSRGRAWLERAMYLRHRERHATAGPSYTAAHVRTSRPERIDIHANVFRQRLGAIAAVAEVQRQRVVGVARDDERRNGHGPCRCLLPHPRFEHIAVLDAETRCGSAAQVRGVSPRQRRDRIGQFLEPGIVREGAVVHARVAGKDDLEASAGRRRQRRCDWYHARRRRGRARRECAVRHDATAERVTPALFGAAPRRPSAVQQIMRRHSRVPEQRGQELTRRDATIQRRDQRLHDRQRTVVCACVGPTLEVMRSGHHPAAVARGFVLV